MVKKERADKHNEEDLFASNVARVCGVFPHSADSVRPLSWRRRWGWRGIRGRGYGLGWYDPFWGPYPYGGVGYAGGAPPTGTVKFDTDNKDTAVFIEGGFAGTVGKLKNLQLRPGTYTIELRAANSSAPYAQRVYVAAGKTVHVNPNVMPMPMPMSAPGPGPAPVPPPMNRP